MRPPAATSSTQRSRASSGRVAHDGRGGGSTASVRRVVQASGLGSSSGGRDDSGRRGSLSTVRILSATECRAGLLATGTARPSITTGRASTPFPLDGVTKQPVPCTR